MADTSNQQPGQGPVASVKDLVVGLYDHYDGIAEIKAYYGVLAIYALARFGTDTADEPIQLRVERILERFPDQIEHPHYNFPSYRIGGLAQSYMLAQGRMQHRRDLLAEYADEMMSAPRDAHGIMTLINQPGDKIWVDVVMAATPFLLYAGQTFNRKDYIDEAISQSVLMYDEFLDPATGLLHQCKNFVAPGVKSSDHWGRGNGWGFFGLTELVRELPQDEPRRAEVEERFVALAENLLPHQGPRGLWRQEIPMESAWEESSGTGLILYGIGVGIRAGLLKGERWTKALTAGLTGLVRHCINPDYSTENSCPGTLCPGTGKTKGTPAAYVELRVPHRNEPHSFAAFILALSVADVVGLTQFELRDAPQSTPYLELEPA